MNKLNRWNKDGSCPFCHEVSHEWCDCEVCDECLFPVDNCQCEPDASASTGVEVINIFHEGEFIEVIPAGGNHKKTLEKFIDEWYDDRGGDTACNIDDIPDENETDNEGIASFEVWGEQWGYTLGLIETESQAISMLTSAMIERIIGLIELEDVSEYDISDEDRLYIEELDQQIVKVLNSINTK